MTEKLAYALSIEPQSSFIDEDNVPEIDDVAEVCAGLTTIKSKSNIVRLVHKSTQEYFERNKSRWCLCANVEMASLCVRYLALVRSSSENSTSENSSHDGPRFTNYARVHW